MTENQSETIKDAVSVATVDNPGFLARIIEDPFASAIAASAISMSAFAFVLTGIWTVQVAIG